MILKIAIILLISTSSFADFNKVIYGEDNRKDIYEVTNPIHKSLANSVMAMFEEHNVRQNSITKKWHIFVGNTLGKEYNLFPDEKFFNQPTSALCTGFLVKDDIVVTAGHCLQTSPTHSVSDFNCKHDRYFVFDYFMKDSKRPNVSDIPDKNVYRCKRVIAIKAKGRSDYAIIQLDRKVKGRSPLRYRKYGKVKTGDKLFVIGHPTGLPLKVADGGKVIINKSSRVFYANLDTFKGNSGSPVFNSRTGRVEGILISGKNDYYSTNGKYRTNRCSMTGLNCKTPSRAPGEGVTRIVPLKRFLK